MQIMSLTRNEFKAAEVDENGEMSENELNPRFNETKKIKNLVYS